MPRAASPRRKGSLGAFRHSVLDIIPEPYKYSERSLIKIITLQKNMIAITQNGDGVTLINVFSCEPQNQQQLVDSWIRVTEEKLGKLPGIISAALHRSKDGKRVVNYAQWESAGDWESLFRTGSESWFREMESTPSRTIISMWCV